MPAFGRPLLQRRMSGDHPRRVYVVYGDDWGRRPTPSVCVKGDWAPHRIDWTPIVGVQTHILWRSGERIRELAAEIAAEAPMVWVHWIEQGREVEMDVEALLFDAYHRTELARLWSPEAQADYQARNAEYYAAILADLKDSETADGSRQRTA